jgi:molybdenum cofactor biosynthesis enzyme MoaA
MISYIMSAERIKLPRMIEGFSEKEISEVIDFIEYLKMKREKQELQDFIHASESSLDFWDNEIDDKIWNDV